MDHLCFCVLCFSCSASVHCCLVVTCLALVGDVFVTFPCGILGQVWYLIVSFPDLCLISYFVLFDLILYVPSTLFQLNRDGSSWVEPVLS